MSILETLLGELRTDAPLGNIVAGALWTAVVVETTPPRCGLASSLVGRHRHEHHAPPVPSAGRLLEKSARALAEGLRSSSPLEAGIGMAALNALLDVDESSCEELNALEIILERGAGRRVVIVGHFPFVDRVRVKAKECCVLELAPGPGDEPAERASEFLPAADVVAMSGTTLINHTFEGLMALCRPGAYVLLLGASTPLTPVLFDYGVDVVAGTRVIDIEAAVRAVSQGAAFPQIPGKRLLMKKEIKSRN